MPVGLRIGDWRVGSLHATGHTWRSVSGTAVVRLEIHVGRKCIFCNSAWTHGPCARESGSSD
eukprot:4693570-Karenia_brevis.AAC.1